MFLAPLLEAIARNLPLLNALSSKQQSTLLFAVLVMVCLVFEPLGIYGLWLSVKRCYLSWPLRN